MSNLIVPNPLPCCRDCGQPLQTDFQANITGGGFLIVTCFNPDCMLRTVTREIGDYLKLSPAELESYREMNRKRDEVCYE